MVYFTTTWSTSQPHGLANFTTTWSTSQPHGLSNFTKTIQKFSLLFQASFVQQRLNVHQKLLTHCSCQRTKVALEPALPTLLLYFIQFILCPEKPEKAHVSVYSSKYVLGCNYSVNHYMCWSDAVRAYTYIHTYTYIYIYFMHVLTHV